MDILYPIFAMAALTLFCLLRLGQLRYLAVRRGEVDPRFFLLYRGYEEPERLALYSRHVVNHFETPTLFYVICVTAFVTNQVGPATLSMAWAYVALRYVHSFIHLGSNTVINRFRAFILSVAVLIALWATVLTSLMRQ